MATAIIGTLVLSAFVGVFYYTYKQKKKGASCCSGCSECSHVTNCHK
ncbi:hypothetical protein GCM10008905_13690 [Clostridium malenominatum]|uniref:FeoB-associated Cys-rich membrane protein n=1 Tax=Clostridium malenominatum TaxID=1539 RepID=A0ABN1IVP3_9CLOT